jgi:hypothetical protein
MAQRLQARDSAGRDDDNHNFEE